MNSTSKVNLIDTELSELAVTKQCNLLGVSSKVCYKPKTNFEKKWIIDTILLIFERVPIYEARKVHQALKEKGISVSVNAVSKYRKELKLEPILAVKVLNLSIPNQQHKKYSYKLRGTEMSMDGKGRATHNICIERFWRSTKCDMLYLFNFDSMRHLKESLKKYIYFFNFEKYHESLGNFKPMDVYTKKLDIQKVKSRKRKNLFLSLNLGNIF
ncbi:MAG: integrase core domain-containing protein, partial [Fusobacteria bacterium]|nr:integrase core domain-containing protein [Fusobacteriota bacterium]